MEPLHSLALLLGIVILICVALLELIRIIRTRRMCNRIIGRKAKAHRSTR